MMSNRGSSSISGESLRLPGANRERTKIGFVSNSGELLRLQNSCEERLEQNTHFCHHDLLPHLSVNHTTFLNFYALLLLLHVIGASLSEPHMISQTVIVSVCLSVCLCVCVCVHRTFTFRIILYACSNLTQMCNISLVQSDSTSRVQVHSQYSTAR